MLMFFRTYLLRGCVLESEYEVQKILQNTRTTI